MRCESEDGIMAEPYEILEIDPNASEEQIRKRYLELVRQFPPDREPERFAAIRLAYDQMRDPVKLMQRRLMEVVHTETIDQIAADFHRRQFKDQRIPARALLQAAEYLKS